MSKIWGPAIIAGFFALSSVHSGQAAEETLRFATTNPPQVHLNAQILHPWAKRINEAGKGVVNIEVRDGPVFASPSNYYERVSGDVAQIAWGIQSSVGKFTLSHVVALPFLATKSETASVAFWRLYEKGALGAEYDDVQPLMMVALPQAGMHFRKEVDLSKLQGLKIIGGSPTFAGFISAIGATPLSINIGDTYETLQRGAADGTMMQYTAFQPFKLGEVTNFHVDTPLGGAGGWVFMMKKKFDGLSADARRIIMENSGEKQSRLYGAFWDEVNRTGRELVDGKPGQKIVTLSPEQEAAWRIKAKQVGDEWAKTVPNGDRVLAAFREELANVEASK